MLTHARTRTPAVQIEPKVLIDLFSVPGYESDACRKLDRHILSEHIQQWGFWQIPNTVHLLKERSAVLMETESIGSDTA